MTVEEERAFWRGVESVLNDLYAEIADLEAKCDDTSYGCGQRIALQRVLERMDLKEMGAASAGEDGDAK